MAESEVNESLAFKLGISSIPDEVWETLRAEQYVSEYLEAEDQESKKEVWGDLLKAARRLLRIFEAGRRNAQDFEDPPDRPTPRNGTEDIYVAIEAAHLPELPSPELEGQWESHGSSLSNYEQELSESLGEFMALCAEIASPLRQFRQEVLEGHLLTPEQAHTFVESPANHCFSLEWFRDKQIPIVEHSAYWRWQDPDTGEVIPEHTERAVREISWTRGGPTVFTEEVECSTYQIRIIPYDELYRKEIDYPLNVDLPRKPLYFPSREGDFVNEQEVSWTIPYLGSVLAQLRWVSNRLRHTCPAWNLAQITQFVLTDEVTPATPLFGCTGPLTERSSFIRSGLYETNVSRRKDTITLSVEPWVSSGSVGKAYRERQLEVMGSRPRAASKRSKALFSFVVKELRKELKGSQGRDELTEEQLKTYETVIRRAKGQSLDARDASTKTTSGGRPPWRVLQERWNGICLGEKWKSKRDHNFSRDFYQAAGSILRSQL